MIRSKKRLRLCTALLCINLIFIWGNSLLPGHISGALSDWLKDLLAPMFGLTPGGSGGGLLRKITHFVEFACLGMCLTWLFGMLQKKPIRQTLFPCSSPLVLPALTRLFKFLFPTGFPESRMSFWILSALWQALRS